MSDITTDKDASKNVKPDSSAYMRRRHARNYRKAPVSITLANEATPRQGMMHNEGIGGMYFEIDIQLIAGTIIRIQLLDNLPSPALIKSEVTDKAYTAEVRWCREIGKNRQPRRFGVGACHRHGMIVQ